MLETKKGKIFKKFTRSLNFNRKRRKSVDKYQLDTLACILDSVIFSTFWLPTFFSFIIWNRILELVLFTHYPMRFSEYIQAYSSSFIKQKRHSPLPCLPCQNSFFRSLGPHAGHFCSDGYRRITIKDIWSRSTIGQDHIWRKIPFVQVFDLQRKPEVVFTWIISFNIFVFTNSL